MTPTLPPDADPNTLATMALDAARKAGATYADIRINRYRNQYIGTREEKLQWISDGESFGFGVRVLAGGAWGFASSTQVTRDMVVQMAQQAVLVARANAAIQKECAANTVQLHLNRSKNSGQTTANRGAKMVTSHSQRNAHVIKEQRPNAHASRDQSQSRLH